MDFTTFATETFPNVATNNLASTYIVQVGKELYGYIRQIRVHQDYNLDYWSWADEITAGGSCTRYGYDALGALQPACDQCSPIPLNTHTANTCYMIGTDDSWGNDERQTCHWRCLRCVGSGDEDCIDCMPGKN